MYVPHQKLDIMMWLVIYFASVGMSNVVQIGLDNKKLR